MAQDHKMSRLFESYPSPIFYTKLVVSYIVPGSRYYCLLSPDGYARFINVETGCYTIVTTPSLEKIDYTKAPDLQLRIILPHNRIRVKNHSGVISYHSFSEIGWEVIEEKCDSRLSMIFYFTKIEELCFYYRNEVKLDNMFGKQFDICAAARNFIESRYTAIIV